MNELLEFAVDAACEAGRATLEHFRSVALDVETKADGSPVTRADREAERILRRRIERACPADGILGEEEGERPGTSDSRWIVDPVDGTRSFARGVPLYGTLVALEREGRVVLGVVYLPAVGELVYAARGEGAWWVVGVRTDAGAAGPGGSRRRAGVSRVDDLSRALLCTTSAGGFARAGTDAVLERLRAETGRDRGWGDCYGHMLVATGRADVMVDPRMAVWDCAALQPIIEEAGGAFFDLGGRARHDGGSAVSVNAALAARVRALVTEATPPA